jgi:osmoprotectant transport system substrate-binding protein
MSTKIRLRALFALLAVALLSLGVTACGDDDDDTASSDGGGLIESNPDNSGVKVTVGSKNFTEQYILGEIYAQGLEAAGYDVSTDLNLGDETVALKALKAGEIDGYPEYTATALTSFFGTNPEDVPSDAQQAYEESKTDFEGERLVSYPPAPYESANAVGTLTSTADELELENVSDLEGQSQDLTLYGSPECRQRPDCLVGLEDGYGLEFKSFTPIDIALRYEVLDKEQADLSILFTSDAQLFTDPDKYTILEDDKGIFPAGNPLFVARQEIVDEAGPDFSEVIEQVQGNLSLKVMQELNARVDIDKEKPADVARDYLVSSGYVE